MSELTSATVPPIGDADHVRGEGDEAILYLDLACPSCATVWAQARELPLRVCVRHFPLRSRRPRAEALHLAVEAAAAQDEPAFWLLWDGLLGDRGRQDDPRIWQLAGAAGLDLGRFEVDRRAVAVAERVRRDLHSGIRAGVTGTPAGFADGARLQGDLAEALQFRASREI